MPQPQAYTTAPMTKAALLALGILLTACGAPATAPATAPPGGIAHLPRLNDSGRELPYIRYFAARAGGSDGRAFFLYPMMDERDELRVLEYSPGRALTLGEAFAPDGKGTSGRVSNEGGVLRIEFLGIALPLNVKAGQQWNLEYLRERFTCTSALPPGADTRTQRLDISCTSPSYQLNFVFSRDRGIEQFQDFCGRSVCTYKLQDGEGLLSDDILKYMQLPQI